MGRDCIRRLVYEVLTELESFPLYELAAAQLAVIGWTANNLLAYVRYFRPPILFTLTDTTVDIFYRFK